MTNLFRWIESRLDEGGWVRRLFLCAAGLMTWRVTVWAMIFGAESKLPGLETAAIIAAVTAPVTMLMKYVFEAYLNSRK